jgi:RNA-directed DNA polymerase
MPQDAPPNDSAQALALLGSGDRVAGMQAKLHRWAAADPGRRFDDLFNLVHDPATLFIAFCRVAGNQGANTPGVDGITAEYVEQVVGVPGFLDDLRAALKDGSFRPLPVREKLIPKPGGSGKLRRLGIPAIADQVGPGRAEARAGAHLRGGLRARLLRVPADAAGARRDRRDPPLRHLRIPLGAGRGYRGGL